MEDLKHLSNPKVRKFIFFYAHNNCMWSNQKDKGVSDLYTYIQCNSDFSKTPRTDYTHRKQWVTHRAAHVRQIRPAAALRSSYCHHPEMWHRRKWNQFFFHLWLSLSVVLAVITHIKHAACHFDPLHLQQGFHTQVRGKVYACILNYILYIFSI